MSFEGNRENKETDEWVLTRSVLDDGVYRLIGNTNTLCDMYQVYFNQRGSKKTCIAHIKERVNCANNLITRANTIVANQDLQNLIGFTVRIEQENSSLLHEIDTYDEMIQRLAMDYSHIEKVH